MSVRDSFLHAHMVNNLIMVPTWTPLMYCVYNDLSDEDTAELIALWDEPNHGLTEPSA